MFFYLKWFFIFLRSMTPVSGMTPSSCLQQRDPGAYSYMLHDTLSLGAYSRASCTPGQAMNSHPSYAVSGASPHSAGKEHTFINRWVYYTL